MVTLEPIARRLEPVARRLEPVARRLQCRSNDVITREQGMATTMIVVRGFWEVNVISKILQLP